MISDIFRKCRCPIQNFIITGCKILFIPFFILQFNSGITNAAELYVGAATADITPSLPVALGGQWHLRIADTAETPLKASVLAIELREEDKLNEMAIMVSCDLLCIPHGLAMMVREKVHQILPDLNINKIFLSATHTHTAPVLNNGVFQYPVPVEGVTQVEEYESFFAQRVSEAIMQAWKNRSKGSVAWGMGQAVIANNRRIHYSNGSTEMYGSTNTRSFINLEGYEDHDINVMFFWNDYGKLIAVTVNVGCPAQEAEVRSTVNADYWHPVRLSLQERYGDDLCVLGWISAAGDQAPRPMYRRAAINRMIELRNLSRLEEISRRIVGVVDEVYEAVKADTHDNIIFIHKVEDLTLPMRLVTLPEYEESKIEFNKISRQINEDPKSAEQLMSRMYWFKDIIERYEKQKIIPKPTIDTEIHIIRIGDIVVCTNQFELFTDYGIRIKARSKALQTFIIQLAGEGSYLPTEKAVLGQGYSAVVQSCLVGPEGGQILVDRTVELINNCWLENK